MGSLLYKGQLGSILGVLSLAHVVCSPSSDVHGGSSGWVAVKEFELGYRNPDTMLFTTYPYYGNLQ